MPEYRRRAADRVAQAAAWMTIVALIIVLLIVGRDFLIPLAISLIVWYLINAIGRGVSKVPLGQHKLPQWLALGIGCVVLILFFIFIGNLIASNIAAVTEAAPTYQANIQALLGSALAWFGMSELPTLQSILQRINVGGLISSLAGTASSFIADAGLVLAYVAFLLFEQAMFSRKLTLILRNDERDARVREVLAKVNHEIQTYIWIKTVTSAIVGGISYAVLVWVGVDYAAFWGFLIFLLNYIPTIGSLLGILFPALLTILQFATLEAFLLVTIPLAVTQIVVGNVVEPKMMGKSLNLSAMVVMVSLVVWGAIWGVAGALLCVPITVMFMIICSYIPSFRPIAIILSNDGELSAGPVQQSTALEPDNPGGVEDEENPIVREEGPDKSAP